MAKPFLIGLEVEEVAFGKVVRSLNKLPGVVKLHLQFELPTKKRTANGHVVGEITAAAGTAAGLVRKHLLKTKKPTNRAELAGVFKKAGRSERSIDSCIDGMKKAQLLQTLSPGLYDLTAKGRKQPGDRNAD